MKTRTLSRDAISAERKRRQCRARRERVSEDAHVPNEAAHSSDRKTYREVRRGAELGAGNSDKVRRERESLYRPVRPSTETKAINKGSRLVFPAAPSARLAQLRAPAQHETAPTGQLHYLVLTARAPKSEIAYDPGAETSGGGLTPARNKLHQRELTRSAKLHSEVAEGFAVAAAAVGGAGPMQFIELTTAIADRVSVNATGCDDDWLHRRTAIA